MSKSLVNGITFIYCHSNTEIFNLSIPSANHIWVASACFRIWFCAIHPCGPTSNWKIWLDSAFWCSYWLQNVRSLSLVIWEKWELGQFQPWCERSLHLSSHQSILALSFPLLALSVWLSICLCLSPLYQSLAVCLSSVSSPSYFDQFSLLLCSLLCSLSLC